MPTPKKGPRLGGSPAHQRAILANLATSLFEHGSITTTEAKARTLRPFAERLITKAKRGDLHNRRQVLSVIRDKTVVHVLFTEIGPRFAERPGGYTRITKIGPRKGDNAPMAVIELVEAEFTPRASTAGASAPARGAAKKAAPAAAEAESEPTEPTEATADATESEPTEQTEDSDAADDTAATEATHVSDSDDADAKQSAAPAGEAAAEDEPAAESEPAAAASEDEADAGDETASEETTSDETASDDADEDKSR